MGYGQSYTWGKMSLKVFVSKQEIMKLIQFMKSAKEQHWPKVRERKG